MRVFTNGDQGPARLRGPVSDGRKERFGMYFPRLFAYAYSLIGDEAEVKDVVSEAFGRVLSRSMDTSEDEFVVELFTTVRDLTRNSHATPPAAGTLSDRERELLAFVFDARLTSAQIRRLTDTTERSFAAALFRALRKLQSEVASSAALSVRPA